MIRKISFILSFLFIVQFSFASAPVTSPESVEVVVNKKGKRKKNGRYKKRRGLFKRIFKGKSNCDCPKH